MRSLFVLGSLALPLSLAGCVPSAQSQFDSAYAAQHQASQAQVVAGCQQTLASYDQAWCNAENQPTYASDAASHEGATLSDMFRTQLQAARAQCADPSLAPSLQRLDGCVATIADLERQERAAQEQRLPAVRAKEPTIRQDPRYVAAKRDLDDAAHGMRVASDNLQVAQAERNANVESYMAAHARAKETLTAAQDALRALFGAYQVDPRDAARIGLW